MLYVLSISFHVTLAYAPFPFWVVHGKVLKRSECFLFLFLLLRYELADKAQAEPVFPEVGRVMDAVSHTAEHRAAAPTTPTKHAVRAR